MASGNSDLLMRCSFASALMNVLLNLMLVPQSGMIGAAIASSVSFAAIEIFMTLKTWKQENIHPFTAAYKRLTMICVFLIVAMLVIKSVFSLTGTGLECTAFILVYFAIIRYANILDKNEIEILSNSLSDIHDNASNKIATLMP
jgi:O-antigen/teichoic acid export membrane protein